MLPFFYEPFRHETNYVSSFIKKNKREFTKFLRLYYDAHQNKQIFFDALLDCFIDFEIRNNVDSPHIFLTTLEYLQINMRFLFGDAGFLIWYDETITPTNNDALTKAGKIKKTLLEALSDFVNCIVSE